MINTPSTLTGSAIGWPPVYETDDHWYFVSNSTLNFQQAERATAIMGGGLYSNRDMEPNLINTLSSILSNPCWIGLEQYPDQDGVFSEPGGGWSWHNGGTGAQNWETSGGHPNNAVANSNYGVLNLNGYIQDKPNGTPYRALMEISKSAKAEVAALLNATVDSENGTTFLELDAANSSSSLSEPIADFVNGIEGTEMKYVQVTINASAASTQADLFLEYNAGTQDSILMLLAEDIDLQAGVNNIQFYEYFSENPQDAATLSFYGMDAIHVLPSDYNYSTHFGEMESLVTWRLHIVDREPGITHSIQDFKIRFEKSSILNIVATDTLLIDQAHGVYLEDVAVVLDDPLADPSILSYVLTAPKQEGAAEANQHSFALSDIPALATKLSTNQEHLNARWTLSVANPGACNECAVTQFGLHLRTPPAIKTGPIRVESGDFLLQQVQVAGSTASIADTTHVDTDMFEDDVITTLIPDYAGNDAALTEVPVSYHHAAALLPDHPDLISITQEIPTTSNTYHLIQSIEGRLIYVSEDPVNFNRAQQDAFLHGGKLITITDQALLDTLISMNCQGWLGHKTTESNLDDWAPILAAQSMQWSGFVAAIQNPATAGRYAYLNADGQIRRTTGATEVHGMFELPTIGTPALRVTPMTADNLLFNVYDLADDKAYVGAVLKDKNYNSDTESLAASTEGLQGYLRKYGKTMDLFRFAHEAQEDPDIGAISDSPNGWSQIGPATDSVSYYISSNLYGSWNAANDDANAVGGRLATAESQDELDILRNGGADAYFGLRRVPESGPWTWVTGAPLDLDSLTAWAGSADPNDISTSYVVAGSTGWRNVSGTGSFRAIMEKKNSPSLVGSDVYMVPTNSDVIGIRYSSDGRHTIPTVALLEDANFLELRDNTPHPAPNWTDLSTTSQSVSRWNVPMLIAPDPTQTEEMLDPNHGRYFAQQSLSGSGLTPIELISGTNHLGTIDLSALWASDDGITTLADNVLASLPGTTIPGMNPTTVEIEHHDLPASHGLWRDGADVATFNVNNLRTDLELVIGGNYDDHILKIEMPITAPMYTSTMEEDVAFNGHEAAQLGLPFWGVPNGTEAYAMFHIHITKDGDNAPTWDRVFTVTENPLVLKNCPNLMEDVMSIEIPVSDLNTGAEADFLGGDNVKISAAALWMTPARRTMVWSHENNVVPLCTTPNEAFSMKELVISGTTLTDAWTDTDGDGSPNYAAADAMSNTVQLTWNHNQSLASSGGKMYLQRRNESQAAFGPEAGWEYIMDIEHILATESEPWANPALFSQAAGDLSPDQLDEYGHPLQAEYWVNRDDSPSDGLVDIIQYTDSTLFDSEWGCETVQYRVLQQICEYPTFATDPVTLSILGNIEDPWREVGPFEDGVFVSEGRYPYKVRIEWDNALDLDGNIDQFRLYRRLYEPAQPDEDAWEQIFSSEDITWFIDQDLAAGILYEYRVGAFVDCGAQNYQEFFNPTPYPIGWRSAFGGATGIVKYEVGTAVDSVYVVVEAQGDYTARNALMLEENEWVRLNLHNHAQRDGGTLTHFPDIHSAVEGEVFTLSQWMRLAKSTVTNSPDDKVPMFSMQYIDPVDNREKEFISIWAETSPTDPGKYRFTARQAGRYNALWDQVGDYEENVEVDYGSYNHLTFTLLNGAPNSGSNTPPMIIEIRVSPDDNIVQAVEPKTGYELRGADDDIANYRSEMSAWLWNAAAQGSAACSDPNATNFEPMEFNGELRYCEYALPNGCTDPFLENVNYLPYAVYDVGGGELTCNYSYFGPGEMIYVDWFTDDTSLPLEYPVMQRKTTGGTYEDVHSFRSNLIEYSNRLSAQGESYPYSMVTMRLDLPEGEYRLIVRDDTDSQDLEAEAYNFSGNFAVRSHKQGSDTYLTCLQYLPSEVAEGTYDFAINASHPVAQGSGGINEVLTDLSESYSVQFRNGKNIQLPLLEPDDPVQGLHGDFTIEWWFRTHSPKPGDDFNHGNVLKLTNNSGNDLSFILSGDDTPSNLNNLRWRVQGSAELNRVPADATRNEYALDHDRWYHAMLAMRTGHDDETDAMRLILRNQAEDTTDTFVWNDPVEFHWTEGDDDSDIISPMDLTSEFQVNNLILGGADVLIHRVSIWNVFLTRKQSHLLAEGYELSRESLTPQTTETTDELPVDPGQWSTNLLDRHPLPLDQLESVLVPDNAGRFVDNMTQRQGYGLTETFSPNNLFFDGAMTPDGIQVMDGELLGAADTLDYLALPTINRRSVRRSPEGESNPGCSRVYNACNFNPFANLFFDCDLSCAGVNATTQEMAAYRMDIDEIRG